ncbi:MAG: hypothetical protein AB7U20_10200 [Planctomycetaceae bacterium]
MRVVFRLRLHARLCGTRLHRFLQRAARRFRRPSEMVVGHLQVVGRGDALGVADLPQQGRKRSFLCVVH